MFMTRNRIMRSLSKLVVLGLVLLCVAPALTAQEGRWGDGKTHPELLVSAAWLNEHLSDPKLVIVHIDMQGMASYSSAHIPGARLLMMEKFSVGDAELPPDADIKAALEGIGISDDSHVVIYTADWQPMASRLFFTLDYIGFKHAAMLDGGMDAWRAKKFPIATEVPAITRGSLTIHPHPEVVAKLADMQRLTNTGAADTVVLDARPLKRYRDGHLPGATVMFWEDNTVDRKLPVLKSPEELRKMYVAAGITPGKKIVPYCEVGEQASYAYFVARYLGYDTAMYDGSWHEWSRTNQPTVKGDNPR